ncbi:PREDICTED: N-glycosylase/DNA lyase [Nicrophorus vespilloides]|uniref:DNA-(apurinic or apyrimidinic site) lyase n=1 Tax=Nicrophorus vespilloides TaxID=110193 RepID=A0ABM1MWF0_NICVS|nr:PREDICTED: N-glycosylase/DNA lyase [Nicrophorus vespilloides]
MSKWCKMFCNSKELQLLGTLNGGQSFRWKKIVKDDCELWYGVFASKVWILQQSHDHILYQVHERIPSDPKVNESLLKDYFQLDLNLEEHYGQWSKADANFQKASEQFYGIRILKQNPVENIFSFICSSCNNISRITSMVEKLAEFYGEIICEIEDKKWYSFATIEHLAGDNVEGKLRELGFGYRAKYISNSAKTILNNGGIKWVENLKSLEYEDAKRQLMTLQGIGAKVADCICLMSLGHLQAIPVDTHVYQIAVRDYMPQLKQQKALTDKMYKQIGEHFRNLYGPLAGWAHTVLFCADLKKFKPNTRVDEGKITKATKKKTSKK